MQCRVGTCTSTQTTNLSYCDQVTSLTWNVDLTASSPLDSLDVVTQVIEGTDSERGRGYKVERFF